jgi:hypothetical protein
MTGTMSSTPTTSAETLDAFLSTLIGAGRPIATFGGTPKRTGCAADECISRPTCREYRYTFVRYDLPQRDDPNADLDMASAGVVKVFDALADIYGRATLF